MYSFLNRSLYCYYLKVIAAEVPKRCKKKFHDKIITLDDTIEEFTSQLTQKKAIKWTMLKVHKPIGYLSNSNIAKDNFTKKLKTYSIDEVNSVFQDCIERGDNSELLNLTKECIEHRKCPSISILTNILTLCAQSGDKETIIEIQKLYEQFHPNIVEANSNFRHYLAEAIWIKGNINESLRIFKEVYSENTFLRRRIRLIFKYLIQDIVSTRSEAALINIVKFGEDLLNSYQDFFPLVCVWQTCFLSEWFTDQCLALELLETHEGLCKAVINRIPYVVTISLNCHRTDVVYRLLELLLKYKMNIQYTGVLSALLDYQLSRRDLRRSLEIVQWSLNHNVKLAVYQNKSFLDLLFDTNKEVSSLVQMIDQVKTNKVTKDLKF